MFVCLGKMAVLVTVSSGCLEENKISKKAYCRRLSVCAKENVTIATKTQTHRRTFVDFVVFDQWGHLFNGEGEIKAWRWRAQLLLLLHRK